MNNHTNHHTNHLPALRGLVETKILVVPRHGELLKGETLTWQDSYRVLHSVTYIGKDTEDRSWVNKDGHNMCVYTYQLSR